MNTLYEKIQAELSGECYLTSLTFEGDGSVTLELSGSDLLNLRPFMVDTGGGWMVVSGVNPLECRVAQDWIDVSTMGGQHQKVPGLCTVSAILRASRRLTYEEAAARLMQALMERG